MNKEDFCERISARIKMIREHCLGWDLETTARVLNVKPEEVFAYEENKEPVPCVYFFNICDYGAVCPDSLIHLPDREKPEGLMRWSFQHYLFKLGYESIDKNDEFKNFKEPNLLEVLNYKDFKERNNQLSLVEQS